MHLNNDNIKRIHVNQHVIRDNKKTGSNNPVFTIKTSKHNHKANTVKVVDSNGCVVLTLGYHKRPLSCGAHVWVETNANVILEEE